MPSQETTEEKSDRGRIRVRTFSLVVLGLAACIGLALISVWREAPDTKNAFGAEEALGEAAAAKALAPFESWGKPDFVLVVSGEEHGYLEPCGCSHPQLGGLTRRYNFIQMLKKRGWDVVAMDLGDIAPKSGLQAVLKYTTSMKALKLMGVTAVGLGANETALPLISALGEYALNNPSPRILAANLIGIEKEDEPFHGMVKPWKIAATKGQKKIGVVGAVGPSVMAKVKDPDVKFKSGPAVLPPALKEMQARSVDFRVLLYQGTEKEATACATALPDFNVVVHLASDSEPPAVPTVVGNSSLITLGHKGRYVGVVGAFRTGKKYTLKYQLVALGEEFQTPAGREKNHPVMKLMEAYSAEVKNKGFLAQASVRKVDHPVQLAFSRSAYLGSDACGKCHKDEYDKWHDSKHAKTYEALVSAKNPSLRQLDPECVRCHVTGWEYKTGFTDAAKSKPLLNNGCESCHGPGSEHVAMETAPTAGNKKDRMKIHDLMNPFRFDPSETPVARKRRLNLLNESCMHCHDLDNDVKWDLLKWNHIKHSEDKISKND
jgi:hypothetical protein